MSDFEVMTVGTQRRIADLEQQVAAKDARIVELREALIEVRADLIQRAEMDMEDGGAILNISNGVLRRMDEALSTPDNTAALDKRLAEERKQGRADGRAEGRQNLLAEIKSMDVFGWYEDVPLYRLPEGEE